MASSINNEESDYTDFFDSLSILLHKVENNEEDPYVCEESINNGIECLLYMQQDIDSDNIKNLINHLRMILQHSVRTADKNISNDLSILNVVNVKETKIGPGRPKHSICESTLLELREIGYTWKEISLMLLVSRWTLWRRVKELGIENVVGYSELTDEELDNIIEEFKKMHGIVVGRSLVIGHLKSIGLRVKTQRVTDALLRVDPVNSRIRWAALVHRRKYSVPGPNSLWHIDGHHSLVKWGFVLHGGIDGFSRLIVFLHCSTNNRKETVSDLFDNAIMETGVPSRIRTDKGGENTLLWERMTDLRGENRGSYLASSSVHNQRIERLWRDVWNSVACEFYYTFQALEDQGKVISMC